MSIEAFFESHPADESFAEGVSWPPKDRVSPIKHLSGILINEGAEGLSGIGNKYFTAVKTRNMDVLEGIKIPFAANTASIYTGVTLLSIEDILSNKEFDQRVFNSRLEMAFGKTDLRATTFENPYCDYLTRREYMHMVRGAMADKTLASFFITELELLPSSLNEFLQKTKVIEPIVELVLPDYVERAKLLISPNL